MFILAKKKPFCKRIRTTSRIESPRGRRIAKDQDPGEDLAYEPARVREAVGGAADGVLSDMAAATTGHRPTDHLRTTALLEAALDFALKILNREGFFLAKCFRGGAEKTVLDVMQQNFITVRHVKPAASRLESVESYVLATGFHGRNRMMMREIDG